MDAVVVPRYRIEHRDPELSPLILAFATTLEIAYLTVAGNRLALERRGIQGGLVIADQERETDRKTFSLRK
jgi:hypothetical protein